MLNSVKHSIYALNLVKWSHRRTDDGVRPSLPQWEGPSAWRGIQQEVWLGLARDGEGEGKEGVEEFFLTASSWCRR